MRLVLLPGLDGTGALFEPFLEAAPPGIEATVVPLPPAPSTYPELARVLASEVSLSADTVLLAESFSGPLALSLAATAPVPPRAVVLVNSFARAPLPAWSCRLVTAGLFALPAPDAVLRHLLLGPDAPRALLARFRAVLAQVPPGVLAARVRALAALDVRPDLARWPGPLVYLRGTEDRLVAERSVAEILAHAPATEVVRVPGPHLLLQAAPARAWAALYSALTPRLAP